jgi:hypothetical protein
MALHFGFLGYVVAGGILAWRWPRAIWPHLPLAGWGLITVVFHLGCPLTDLEDWARRRAGEPGLQAASSTTTWPESCIPSGTAAWCGCSPPSLSGCCGSARRSGGTAVAPSLALTQADSPSGARRHGRGRPDGPDQSVTRMP